MTFRPLGSAARENGRRYLICLAAYGDRTVVERASAWLVWRIN